jgi:hypothetical protein
MIMDWLKNMDIRLIGDDELMILALFASSRCLGYFRLALN